MVLRASSWLPVTIVSALLVGCSGGSTPPPTVPVSGTIKVKGQPAEGLQVSFMPKQGAPRAAIGTTDAQGKYRLTTFRSDDGAVVGTHTVTVSKATKTAPGAEPVFGKGSEVPQDYMKAMMKGGGKAAPKIAPDEAGGVPPKYASPTSSGLEAKVTKEGPNNFDFDLQ